MIMMASGFLCLFISLGCLVGPSVSFITATGTTVSITVSKHVNCTCRAPLGNTSLSASTLQILTFDKIKFHNNLNNGPQWLLDGIRPIAAAHQGQAVYLNTDFAKLGLGVAVEGSYEDGIKVDIPNFNFKFKNELSGNCLWCRLTHINTSGSTQEYEVYWSNIIPIGLQSSGLLPFTFSEGFQCSVEDVVQGLPGVGNRSMVVCPPGSSPTTDNGGYGDCATWHSESNLTMTESDQLHKRCYLKFRIGKKDISYECTGKTLDTFDCTCVNVHDVEEQSSGSYSCSCTIQNIIILLLVLCAFFILLVIYFNKDKLCNILCTAGCGSQAGSTANTETDSVPGCTVVLPQDSPGDSHDEDDDRASSGVDRASSAAHGVLLRGSGRAIKRPAAVQYDQDTFNTVCEVTSASSSS